MTALTSPLLLPLAERRRRLAAGDLDPEEYRRELVEHIRARDPEVRAFTDWRPGDSASPALPWAPSVTYKDTIDVAGHPTRLGIRSGYRRYPTRSAEVADRLAGRSLVCVGKVSTTECALGTVRPSANPTYPGLSAAGSSTGSAVSVAAGLCDVSVGTDSGGSLRWPAVYCGVTALRITPRPELLAGVHAVAPSLESVGLVTRTPADLAWLWRTYRLATAFDLPAVPAPTRLRVAVSAPPGEPLHPELAALLGTVRDRLAADHDVTEPPLPELWAVRAPAAELLAREARDSLAPLAGVDLGTDTLRATEAGARVDDARYAALRERQRTAETYLADLLRTRYDIVIMPLEADLPDRADRPAGTSVALSAGPPALTLVANIGRLPVLALPLGHSTDGSPLGVQVLAAPGADDLLVSVAQLLTEGTHR
ncbi:MAG TPA: amidase [Mycobacteriales bacterium]|nr:amidase [Mycobacteriales bacterium]